MCVHGAVSIRQQITPIMRKSSETSVHFLGQGVWGSSNMLSHSKTFHCWDKHHKIIAVPLLKYWFFYVESEPGIKEEGPQCSTLVSYQTFSADLAPIPLTIFRSNSRLDKNLKCAASKCMPPITTKFCTRQDSVTAYFKVECSKFLTNFEFVLNTVSGTGACCHLATSLS